MNNEYKRRLKGTSFYYFDSQAAINAIKPNAYESLPYSVRIFAENLVRRCEPSHLRASLCELINKTGERDFPWFPERVICHDILGQTAFVDLAGLRETIAEQGGDPSKINPVVPTQLIVDHSLTVEHAGFEIDALEKNMAIELHRNDDRFHFIDWIKKAFKNIDVIQSGNGIMHQINLEKMSPVIHSEKGIAFPDSLIGTDSHTPMINALGVLGIGVGGLEAESVMLGRPSYLRLPQIIGIELTGHLNSMITSTDLVLTLTEYLRKQNVVSSYLEFYGEGTRHLTLGDRATISNMAPEFGASAALFYIDEQTIDYLTLTGRESSHIEFVKNYAQTTGLWADDLKTAQYDKILSFDLSQVVRSIAGPSTPHNRVPTQYLSDYGISDPSLLLSSDPKEVSLSPQKPYTIQNLPDGACIIAAITSCTNTSNPRNMIAAGLMARNANRLGLKRKPWVKTSLAPGSKTVKYYLESAHLLKELEQLGFGIVGFACTSCNGMSGKLDPIIQKTIEQNKTLTSAVLSGNRNFDGRIHPYASQAFLASPPLVVAYAIAGSIRCDIEKMPLGYDEEGNPIMLNAIWPSDQEIEAVIKKSVLPEQFNRVYDPMFKRDPLSFSAISPLYPWREKSTYIRRPPYWEASFIRPSNMKSMRALAVLGDNITTDHLSPSNAIQLKSAAGEYLASMGVQENDFNSYATHRGDHLTAQRATLANPKLYNEMNIKNEKVQQGSYARIEPEGTIVRMWEAIETYLQRQQSLIIIAGADYGQGSSRDWAAKGVRLAGVEVIVAESFERIHRTNLIGMGVLPLAFISGETRKTHQITGSEFFDVIGKPAPQKKLTLLIHKKDQTLIKIDVLCRIDTTEECSIYEAGGVLQRFSHDFLEKK
jgi:aconitate hydratase